MMQRVIPLAALATAVISSSCTRSDEAAPESESAPVQAAENWRDGGTCYEIFVRSFKDSDGDGIGDRHHFVQAVGDE